MTERRDQLDAVDLRDGSTAWSLPEQGRDAGVVGDALVLIGPSTLTMLGR